MEEETIKIMRKFYHRFFMSTSKGLLVMDLNAIELRDLLIAWHKDWPHLEENFKEAKVSWAWLTKSVNELYDYMARVKPGGEVVKVLSKYVGVNGNEKEMKVVAPLASGRK